MDWQSRHAQSQFSRLVTLTRADGGVGDGAADDSPESVVAVVDAASLDWEAAVAAASVGVAADATSVELAIGAGEADDVPVARVLALAVRDRFGEVSLLVPSFDCSFSNMLAPGVAVVAAAPVVFGSTTIFSFFLTNCLISSNLAATFAISVELFLIRFLEEINFVVYVRREGDLEVA